MAETQIRDRVRTLISEPKKLLIGGAWVDAASGKTFPVYDPATGEVLARVAEADFEDIDRAVRAARVAFDEGPWRRITPSERGRMIWRLADLIEANLEEFATLEALDSGKPISAARAADVPAAVDLLRYMAGWATKIEGETIPISASGSSQRRYLAYTLREPVGVVGLIVPWNFPLLVTAWKLGPALATGCTVVLKPAEQTPLTALLLGEMVSEAGFPEGVVNVVPGYGGVAGAALTAHPNVDKVSFTGSTEVGRTVLKAAAGNLKKVSLELGGKSPNIVFADADLEAAVKGAADGIFYNQGEACTAGSRLYVERAVFDEIVGGVAEQARKIKVGPGVDPSTEMGPLVSKEQLDKVCGYLDSGYADGARAVVGGGKAGGKGYFVEPTVLVDVKQDMDVVQEEIFGPVVTALPFDSAEEVLPAANDTVYGLVAGIWTRDISKANWLASELRAGTVWINCYGVMDAALPFGGYKQSGWGREMGHHALDQFTEVKAVCTGL